MEIFVIALAVFVGFGFALAIVEFCVKRSNDIGDSRGSFEDFSKSSLVMFEKADDVSKDVIKKVKKVS